VLEQVTVIRCVSPLREGGALYFHHNWTAARPPAPFDASDHVLREAATRLAVAPGSTMVQPGPCTAGSPRIPSPT
jgi:hypothetical protein